MRSVAYKASLHKKDRYVVEGIKAPTVPVGGWRVRPNFKPLKQFFLDNELRPMLSNKEGGFVVASRPTYLQREQEAMNKHFLDVPLSPRKEKGGNVLPVERNDSPGKMYSSFKVFFYIKTHKADIPSTVNVPNRDKSIM